MYLTSVTVKELNNVSTSNFPIQFSLPLKNGICPNENALILIDDEDILTSQIKKISTWPDGSIRWARITCLLPLVANESKRIEIHQKLDNSFTTPIQADATFNSYNHQQYTKIETAHSQLKIYFDEHHKLQWKLQEEPDTQQTIELELVSKQGQALTSVTENLTITEIFEGESFEIKSDGYFAINHLNTGILFQTNLTFFSSQGIVKWNFRIINSCAAKHIGGFWDLGDEGSFLFSHLNIKIKLKNNHGLQWKTHVQQPWQTMGEGDWALYQCSSGGIQWNRSNHVNKDGIVPLKFKGYRCSIDGTEIEHGDRSQPLIKFKTAYNKPFYIYTSQFWENFPKSINCDSETLTIGLFPQEHNDLFELQGGESKTHTILFGFGTCDEDFTTYISPPDVQYDLNYICGTPTISGLSPFDYKLDRYFKIIDQGLSGPENFFEKREKGDEYGWRNFGDIWADHETLEHGNDDSLVSHYNNQYDMIFGFFLQYIRTGNRQWFSLMDDLARHVIDIDIYNTEQDREEYNYGLFWHTDHYLDAATSTHRSFSIKHLESDHVAQSGGGPGSEHCYSTGLAYHYFMTHSSTSKDAVLGMAKWMIHVMEGTGTILELLKQLATKDRILIKRILKKEAIPDFKYPFTRGTGNYINTMLDAYLVTGDQNYMMLTENIILNSIHPKEDINQRNLFYIEKNWSYTIYLQALARYLFIKIEETDFDHAFQYALESFKRYADWIHDNEKLYLSQSESLDYPNATWVAQEARKAAILYAAGNLFGQEAYFQRAEYFITEMLEFIEPDTILKSTRIIAIFMQNSLFFNRLNLASKLPDTDTSEYLKSSNPYKTLNLTNLMRKRLKELAKAIRSFSIKKEYKWLQQRI